MKLEYSRQIFEKFSNIQLHENPFQWEPSCSMRAEGQTDRETWRSFNRLSQFCKRT